MSLNIASLIPREDIFKSLRVKVQSAGWGFLMPILGFHFGGLELRVDTKIWQSGIRDKVLNTRGLFSDFYIFIFRFFKVAAAPRGTPAPSINFLVKPEEKRKYDALFNQLKPTNGILPGDKVKQDHV